MSTAPGAPASASVDAPSATPSPVAFPGGGVGEADEAAHARREARVGLLYGLGAYGWWGVAPLYFHLLTHVPALTVLCHRIVWSVVFLGLILLAQRRWSEVAAVLRDRRTLGWLAISAGLISVNWFVFIYSVETGRVVQASLGYHTHPPIPVLLGWPPLRERLRPWQWVSVALATIGVGVAATGAGGLPWIALTLAVSFALYGLLRKTVRVGPMIGLFVETTMLMGPAMLLIIRGLMSGDGPPSVGTTGLLMTAGVITALPLLWFVAAARRLTLTTIGFLQYIAPSMQLVMAVGFLGEALDARRVITFGFIWAALAVFSVDSMRRSGASR
ncbi:MAG: EamA family transporter RarD [Phycisphaerales bacterium]|nr:EamA family transporter RarD [Phycisphaerales bacterium]